MKGFETNIYKVIDDELNHLSQYENGANIEFDVYTAEGQQVLEIIKQHNLITFRSSEINSCIADITIKGYNVIKTGGIKTYLESFEKKILQKENKEALELEKIKSEIIILKKEHDDYRINKWMARLAFIISIFLAILEFIKFLIHKS